MLVCHKCDVRLCVNPDHLFVGTRHDNMADCARKGRTVCKLSPDDVRHIRKEHEAGTYTKAELARRYGVTDVMVGNIVSGKWWKHLLEFSLRADGKSSN